LAACLPVSGALVSGTGADFGAGLPGAGSGWASPAGAAADWAGFAGAAFGAAAPSVILPSTAPGSTVAPSSALISESVPSDGAATSRLTLSVSSSTRISSLRTASPAFLVQRATVASVTDSPSAGVMMSAMGKSSLDSQRHKQS